MFKKLLLSFLTAIVLITSVFATPVHAQATWYNQNFYEWYTKVYDTDVSPQSDIFGERYTAAQVQWIFYSIPSVILNFVFQGNEDAAVCFLGLIFGGSGSLDDCTALVFPGASGPQTQFYAQKKGAKSIVARIFEDRPLSGIGYVKQKLRKFSLVPEAKAQGFGFTAALDAFQAYWQASRDIVYSLFVIATVIMAFMIMFRVKLSPQTVITVQSAIPKIVIGLILVTFSYAIAGFLVDLMYVAIGILSVLMATSLTNILDTPIDSGVLFDYVTVGPSLLGSSPTGIWGLVILYLLYFPIAALAVAANMLGLAGGIISIIVAVIALGAVGAISAILLAILLIVIIIALLVFIIKTIFMLTKTFVNIVLLTIVAPFQILIGLFYQPMGFSAWMRSYVSNLSVFVVTGFLFLLSYLFLAVGLDVSTSATSSTLGSDLLDMFFGTSLGGSRLSGPVTPGWPPLLAPTTASSGFLFLGISFVMFTLIPKASEFVKSILAGKPFAYGTGVGEALAPAAAAGLIGGQLASGAQKHSYEEYRRQLRAGTAIRSRPQEWIQNISEAIRQASGGKIR